MSKRFTDTEKWRKRFMRSMPAEVKLFWLYMIDTCNHAGIWEVDFDAASLFTGCQLYEKLILDHVNQKIHSFDNGEKWFIPSFIEFQYGKLNPHNKVHKSVIDHLSKYGLMDLASPYLAPSKHHPEVQQGAIQGAMEGAKDKDKDKETEMDKEKDKDKETIPTIPADIEQIGFSLGWTTFPSGTWREWSSTYPPDWIRSALVATESAQTAGSGVSPKYVSAILRRYQKQGGPDCGNAKGNNGRSQTVAGRAPGLDRHGEPIGKYDGMG